MADKVPEGTVNGCGCIYDVGEAEKAGKYKSDDPIQEHYKKTGFWGAITGAFGDKKTMYCHHQTKDNEWAVRYLKNQGLTPTCPEEVWTMIGKSPCCGRYAFDRATKCLKCGPVVKADHDNTCNAETCPFLAFGFPCPEPKWALKD
eukprot:TRINITY_DN27339_c0_g1_i1.p1 TRINITY_DN27339_c0_g1~~TRINITY_DN27339_c0_g1_i1.p1  ORF type:complete len:146 (-),score=31.54 TRINITY_DN27339_c0_g1_i1:195-632(-)